jgi:hypothetical protein
MKLKVNPGFLFSFRNTNLFKKTKKIKIIKKKKEEKLILKIEIKSYCSIYF